MGNVQLTKRIKIYGIVQGVGFRPTVARHAEGTFIRGSVCNRGSYVEVIAQGTAGAMDEFLRLIREEMPERAVILKLDARDFRNAPVYKGFRIVDSEKEEGEIFISPDIAICDTCRKELLDPADRRYLHPFINCTSCGPRLTILEKLPYDRERTSMKIFPMCPECRSEYTSPQSRRYDAQPVCCNDCGPSVYLIGRKERGREAITEVRQILADGGIAAVKGIGGFHLCCDAENTEAVMRLRKLKSRPAKPFAVMMRDAKTVFTECEVSAEQEKILTGHQKPILLLNKKSGGRLSEAVAPDNPKVGVMLPYAPIQILLFRYDDEVRMPSELVMTSGNVSGAPICRDDEEAVRELSSFVDVFLSNDRPINIRCDDSVMDFYQGEPYMIRRSRGYAPLPYMMSDPAGMIAADRTVLAIGGELKNTFCIGKGNLFYPSSYIGDLEDLRSGKALEETAARFEKLLEAKPDVIVSDLHPGYHSTEIAEKLASAAGIPLIKVQHHYAHILSCMAENDFLNPCIGISYDGTGYGTDGTIWGGEILLADVHGFKRLCSVKPFLHVGGDAASREGYRIAASMISDLYDDPETVMTELGLCAPGEAKLLHTMHDRKINAIRSTSMGRIFDAAAAILGIRLSSTFEGEAATTLMYRALEYEKKCGRGESGTGSDHESDASGQKELRTDLLIRELIRRKLEGENVSRLSYDFHAAIAARTAEMVQQLCREEDCGRMDRTQGEDGADAVCTEDSRMPHTVALSGGCFQNTLLLRLTEENLRKNGFTVLRHRLVPPNDGGIALGQALFGNCSRQLF